MRAVGKIKALNEKVKEHRVAKMTEIAEARLIATQAVEEINETVRTGLSSDDTDDQPATISPELGTLLGGRISKHDHEAAETAYYNEQYDDDDEHISINIRNQY